MSLKFDKLLGQIQRMGRHVAYQTEELSERGQEALNRLDAANDLEAIQQRIDLVRQKDAGYRGAAPLTEPINQAYTCNGASGFATIVAVDGSQVYPNLHASALYYLINIGSFVYYHGDDRLPLSDSEPALYYADADLRDRHGHGSVIKNTAVNARRSVDELTTLARICWEHRDFDGALIGVVDGPLLWWLGRDIPYADQLERDYHNALKDFHKVIHVEKQANHGGNASLVGYVERGDSRFVIRLLHLLGLQEDEITRSELDSVGPFEGLGDDWLFSRVLEAGERSAVMVQQSPQNRDYRKDLGDDYEIAFFYLNVGAPRHAHIVRIEIPMWVAQSPAAIDEVHSILLAQCSLTGQYPYVLTRAHELALVNNIEKRQLDELIVRELLANHQPVEKSPKQRDKDLVAAGRRQRFRQPTH